MVPRFTLLTRPGCHLCEELEAAIAAEFGERLEIEAVQVDHHPGWLAQYGTTIPVLLDPLGQFVCAVTIDEAMIEAALAQPAG